MMVEGKNSTQSQLNKGAQPAESKEGIVIRTMQRDLAVLTGKPLPPSPRVAELRKKAPPPAKLPVTKAGLGLTPLAKPSPFKEGLKRWLEMDTIKESRSKIILIGLAILVVVGGVGGFFYWWVYLREVPPPPVVTHYECQNFQCLSLEGEGINQCQTDEDCQPVEPTVPEPLIPVEETQTIELALGDEKWLTSELEIMMEKEQASSTFKQILVKLVGQREIKYLDLESLFSALRIEMPENILRAVPTTTPGREGENYTLFFFGQSEGNRLGIVMMIKEDSLDLMLKLWEGDMKTDLRPLHLGLRHEPADKEGFLDNVYQGVAIRYINFPDPTLSIDYAVVDDKLIIATSRLSMYTAIDALLPTGLAKFNDPEIVRSEIADHLRRGDIESALKSFKPTEKSAIISTFNTEQLNQLADWIEKATLMEEKENSRIYRYTWTDELGEGFIEFIMAKNEEDQWIITNW